MNYTQAQIDRANAVSLEDFLRTQGETPVSYTHLDVYKRQLQTLSISRTMALVVLALTVPDF